jgi:hypothetical protein
VSSLHLWDVLLLTRISESVDIYHVSPQHPRLAYVAFIDPNAGISATETLHRQPISLDAAAVTDNPEDYEVWRDWNDTLTVVKAEPPLLIPSSVVDDFADLPEWAKRGASSSASAGLQAGTNVERKRDRMSRTPGLEAPESDSYVMLSDLADQQGSTCYRTVVTSQANQDQSPTHSIS